LLYILPHSCPPKIHEGCQGRQLLADLFHDVVLYRALMVLGSCCDGSDFGLQPAVDLSRSLRGGVVDVQRMQGEREHCQVVAIRAVHPLPALHFRTPHLHLLLGRKESWRRSREKRLLAEYLLSLRALLAGVAHPPSDGERVALHQIMHDMKEIGHTQAL
jgi:hypothetical protein